MSWRKARDRGRFHDRFIPACAGNTQQFRPRDAADTAVMPPQTPGALDKKIGGGKIGHHQIEIEVQALLHHLGRHQHTVARATRAVPAK